MLEVMDARTTHIEIAGLTDEGVFEDLALSVLRIADPRVAAAVQTGLNAEGRTHASPLDAIAFVQGANPEHLVAVHHTITPRNRLRGKWLGEAPDPAKAGDILKTIAVVEEERQRTPDLKATLFLTSSSEPSEGLVRDARAMGREHGIEVEFWPASRLAHVLDTTADGQAVRRRILGRPQDRLSIDLLREVGRASLEASLPPDDVSAWIDRTPALKRLGGDIAFLIGDSGSGKTVACLQALSAHLDSGGVGLVVTAETIGAATTLDAAIEMTLKAFQPSLADGRSALEFGSDAEPMLIVIEDVNRTGNGPRLAAKLAGWSLKAEQGPTWRLLCPLWPQTMTSIDETSRKAVDRRSVELPALSGKEAAEMVRRRAETAGRHLTEMQAEAVAEALGRDPLLIALHDFQGEVDAATVIEHFVENALQRVGRESALAAPALREALDRLTDDLLLKKALAPDWGTIVKAFRSRGEDPAPLQLLLVDRSLVSLAGPSTGAILSFRHDRVREHLLVRSAVRLATEGRLNDSVVGDAALADVFGGAIVESAHPANLIDRCSALNPLSLFDAYRRVASRDNARCKEVVSAIDRWTQTVGAIDASPAPLIWSMTEKLGQADGPDVIRLARALGPTTLSSAVARLRNGDIEGGIYLCYNVEPGSGAPWRDRCIAHAWARHRGDLLKGLRAHLVDRSVSKGVLAAILRLAGHIGAPELYGEIVEAWHRKQHRDALLDDYIWAATRCADEDVSGLRPMYDAWAELSDERDEHHRSPRSDLVHGLKWAFSREPPLRALSFLVECLERQDLRSYVLSILEALDHPQTVVAVAEAWADSQRSRKLQEMHFGISFGNHHWGQGDEYHTPMSDASRAALAELWTGASDDALALASFELWSATHGADDLARLASAPDRAVLRDPILRARLQRGDISAVPEQIKRIRSGSPNSAGYWWQFGRDVWSPLLTNLLDETLSEGQLRTSEEGDRWIEGDWIQSEMIMRLEPSVAEALLVRHWDHIRQSRNFVQAALYTATPETLQLVAGVVAQADAPGRIFKHLSIHYGSTRAGRGVTRREQIVACKLYLDLMEDSDIEQLAGSCNELGWYDLRREIFDPTGRVGWAAVSENGLRRKFDSILSEPRSRRWIDRSIEDILKTGTPWSQVLQVAEAWCREKGTNAAVIVLASLIQEAGYRADLMALVPYCSHGSDVAAAIAEAEFVVRRRGLT